MQLFKWRIARREKENCLRARTRAINAHTWPSCFVAIFASSKRRHETGASRGNPPDPPKKTKKERKKEKENIRWRHQRPDVTLMTSAPKSDIRRDTDGAATTLAISTTRIPAKTGAPFPGVAGRIGGHGICCSVPESHRRGANVLQNLKAWSFGMLNIHVNVCANTMHKGK